VHAPGDRAPGFRRARLSGAPNKSEKSAKTREHDEQALTCSGHCLSDDLSAGSRSVKGGVEPGGHDFIGA
jgi:hypothetical protein